MDAIDERFLLVDTLGRGGMARVDLGEDRVTGRSVVLKRLLPPALAIRMWRRRLRLEAKFLGRLQGTSVPRFVAAGKWGGQTCLVMEYVRGETLRSLLDLPDWRPAAGALVRTAEALDAIHERGVVHLDVKAQNVLVEKDGSIRIVDLGIARPRVRRGPMPEDEERKVLGTIPHVSPERFLRRDPGADPREDVYALGGILYRLLAGRSPFDGPAERYVERMLHEDPPHPGVRTDAPEALARIALCALAREPSKRFPSARAFAEALAATVAGAAA